jgi:hypothetical protein
MEYSDVIHQSDRFFELGLNILVVQSCDLSCIEDSDVIYHSDHFFELNLNMSVA